MKIRQHDTASIVIRKDGKYLLVKRAQRPEKGFWAVPGGHVDGGESVWEASQREAVEEVGEVEVDKEPFHIFVHDVGIAHRHRAHCFFGKVRGELEPGGDAEKLEWFSIEEMEKLELTHYTKATINHILEKGL